MHIKQITVEGFKSAKNKVTVNLDDVAAVAVVGENGAGKSTVFSDAVIWALFGTLPAGYTRNANRIVSQGAPEARVTVTFRYDHQTWSIERARTRAGKVAVTLSNTETGVIASGTHASVDPHIVALIGDADRWLNTCWIRQGDANRFSTSTPAERFSIVAATCGVDGWDAAAKSERAALRALKEDRRVLEARYDASVQHAAMLDGAAAGFTVASGDLGRARDAHTKAVEQRAAVTAEQERFERDTLALVSQIETVTAAIVADEETRRRLVDDLRTELAQVVAEIRAHQTVIDTAARYDHAALAAQHNALADRLDGYNKQIAEIRAAGETASETRTSAEAAAAEAETFAAETTEMLAVLRAHQVDGSSECPTCGQHVASAAALIDALTAKNDARTAAAVAARRAAETATVEHTRLREEYRRVAADAKRVEQERKDIEVAVADAATAATRAESAAAALTPAEQRRAALAAKIAAAAEQIVDPEEDARIVQAREGLATIEAALTALPNVAQLDTVVTAETRNLEQAERRHTAAAADVALRESHLNDAATVQTEIDDLETLIALRSDVVAACSRTGIPSRIMADRIEQIEQATNTVLASFTSGITLQLRAEKVSADGERTIPTLDVNAVGGDLELRSYDTFSAGERFRVDLALRIAMAQVAANGDDVSIVIDEGFGALDEPGLDEAAGVLAAAAGYGQIICLSHVAGLTDRFPHRAVVTKTAGVTHVEMVG